MGVSSSAADPDQHLLTRGHDRQPAADVLQLAHVARPGETADVGLGIRVQALGLHVQLLGGAQQEVLGQLGYILAALLEGRNMNADDVEAVERSSRNSPSATRFSRFWWVAAMILTSTCTG